MPVVIADRMDLAASGRLKGFKAHPDFRPDYIYCGRNLPPVEQLMHVQYQSLHLYYVNEAKIPVLSFYSPLTTTIHNPYVA